LFFAGIGLYCELMATDVGRTKTNEKPAARAQLQPGRGPGFKIILTFSMKNKAVSGPLAPASCFPFKNALAQELFRK
jgi:hypothetical protein